MGSFATTRSRPGESIYERHLAEIVSRPESTEVAVESLTSPLFIYVDSATYNNEESASPRIAFGYDLFTSIIGMMANTFGETFISSSRFNPEKSGTIARKSAYPS